MSARSTVLPLNGGHRGAVQQNACFATVFGGFQRQDRVGVDGRVIDDDQLVTSAS